MRDSEFTPARPKYLNFAVGLTEKIMLFGTGRKKLAADFERSLNQRDDEIADLRSTLVRLQDENANLQQQLSAESEKSLFVQSVFKSLTLFGESFSELQGSLASMANAMRDEKQAAVRGSEISTVTRGSVESMAKNVAQVSDLTREGAKDVVSLSETTSKISDFVTIIHGISEQTNLLALNAAIEAARAGEQGRGFAVVADEVRSLAGRTREATTEIATLVESISHETNEARNMMSSVTDLSQSFESQVEKAVVKIQEQLDLSKNMEGAISSTALRSFVEIAKLDHLVFKFSVYQVFMGLSELSAAEISNHESCRLGHWYYEGEGVACFSHLPGYSEMENPHKSVHEHGRKALEAYHAGNTTAGVKAIQDMEQASLKVLRSLEQLALAGEKNPDILCTAPHAH